MTEESTTEKRGLGPWLTGGLIALAVIVAGLLFANCSSGTNGGEVPPDRLSGEGRHETAVEVSQFRYPDGAPHVYVASDSQTEGDFADALVATRLDGPILLVPSCDGVPDVVADEIRRLAPTQVTVIGGEEALCAATEVSIRELIPEQQ